MPNARIADYSFLDPKVQREPFDFYRLLRHEQPVMWSDEMRCFVVSRYETIWKVLRDTETFTSIGVNGDSVIVNESVADRIRELRASGYPSVPHLVTNDPPDHGKYRKLWMGLFSQKHIAALQPSVDRIIDSLLTPFVTKGGGDFMAEFAVPVPVAVMADFLGIPLDLVPTYRTWTDAYVDPLSGMLSPEREIECAELTLDFQRFFVEEIEKRRREPRDDGITKLIHEPVPGEDRTMDTAELLAAIQQFLVAGGETTTFTLGSGVLILAQRPDLAEALQEDPKRLINFTEEVLRLRSPSQGLYRAATKDTEIEGVAIPKGAIVNVRIGAANRDEAIFEDADEMHLDRRNAARHLTFGSGVHTCLGAQLARMEVNTTFSRLLSQVRNIRVDEAAGGYDYFPSVFFMGLSRLHLAFDPR
ncbi:MAG: cytochrome P450 [Alphaproteobacteria bacterium]|nr:cytochrome P450 [Alphaproteobacteria bacterium]